jgi:hypothetical protein
MHRSFQFSGPWTLESDVRSDFQRAVALSNSAARRRACRQRPRRRAAETIALKDDCIGFT